MIRNLVSNRSVNLFRRSFVTSPGPAPITTILLKGLNVVTTEESLKKALGGLPIAPRAIDIEPGCSLQFLNQCEADVSASAIKSTLGYKTEVANASIPSLNLHNVPLNVTSESLTNAFRAHRPKKVHVIGGLSVEFVVVDASAALRISRALELIALDGQKLETKTVKLSNSNYSVKVYNFPGNYTVAEAEKLVLKEVSSDDSLKVLQLTSHAPVPKVIKIRLSADDEKSVDSIKAAFKSAKLEVSDSRLLDLPAVIIRNVGYMEEQHVRDLFNGLNAESLNLVRRSKDSYDHVVAYFKSEKDALHCLSALKDVSVNERKLSAVYREIPQPAVILRNLPANVTESEVASFLGVVQFSKIKLQAPVVNDKGASSVTALVHVASPFESKLARNSLNRKTLRNRFVNVSESEVHDLEMCVSLDAGSSIDDRDVLSVLNPLGVVPKSLVHESNRHAFVDFLSLNEANAALKSFNKGTITLSSNADSTSSAGGVVTSSVTANPAYILQVADLPTSSPASKVVDAVLADKAAAGVSILKLNRNATVKCKRLKDVNETMKSLRPILIDDQKVQVEKYAPLQTAGDTEYDATNTEQNDFDQFSLRTVLKDFLYSDPATRYEIARNYFERALNDATALSDITKILDKDASPAMKEETKNLLFINSQSSSSDPEELHRAKKRLFELFVQKEEMQKFTHDFREIEAFLGPVDENDAFDWAKFALETDDDLERMKRETKEVHDKHNQALLEAIRGKNANDPFLLEMDAMKIRLEQKAADRAAKIKEKADAKARKAGSFGQFEDNYKDRDEDEKTAREGENQQEGEEQQSQPKEEVVSLLDPEQLRDREGNLWSGVVLNTDMTQKTMPGGRVMRHRALVMIGNLRGAGGFGMGKGQTPADAVNAAFRSALSQVIHVDLYDNFGLAHDLHGKFNSCHCYIRATPRDREQTGSMFAEEVLTRFGMASYSCKFVGRKDPYAMIHALFNALGGHENIDEFAKDRGKRYLTLRWGYNNKV